MNYFEILPLGLIKNILFCKNQLDEIYYYFSLNLVDRSWNDIIEKNSNKSEIAKKCQVIDKRLDFYMLKNHILVYFMDRFVQDRRNLDVYPYLNQSDISDENKMILKIKLMIKYNLNDLIMKQAIDYKKYSMMNAAASFGNLDVIIYLHENGYIWNESCCEGASAYGQLEVLKYLHENGCPWNEKCCEKASSEGHLECLKYLHENGCPWNAKSTHFASQNRHSEVLKYLHVNGCPCYEECCEDD